MRTNSVRIVGKTHISKFGVEALICHVEKGHEKVKVYPLLELADEQD